MHLFSFLTFIRFYLQIIGDVNPLDDQYFSVFFDFPPRLGIQPAFTGWNLARFQRTAKSSGQSACC